MHEWVEKQELHSLNIKTGKERETNSIKSSMMSFVQKGESQNYIQLW